MSDSCSSEIKRGIKHVQRELGVGKLYRAWVSFSSFFWAFIVSLLIVYLVRKSLDYISWILITTLTILLFVIFRSAKGTGYYSSLPQSAYPLPPHMGLDGVSLETRASY